jgi:hypothetical protein
MWPPFILLVALSLQHIQKNVKHISLAMLLIISSVIPYWQLNAQHIPLKSFLLFIIITMGVAFGIKKPSAKRSQMPVLLLMLLIMATSMYHWYINFPKNPTQNIAIKKLALRNQGLSRISVLGMPYESALFYFNTGNVITDIGHYDKEKYVLHKNTSAPLDVKNFTLIDKESDLFLYKHND